MRNEKGIMSENNAQARNGARPIVLIIDQDQKQRTRMETGLKDAGYSFRIACSGEEALEEAARARPDLILMGDIPDMTRSKLYRWLHRGLVPGSLSVIVVGCRSVQARIESLEMGVDDCLELNLCELALRAKNVLKNAAKHPLAPTDHRPIELAGFVIDPARFTVTFAGSLLKLTPCQFKILHYLVKHAGNVMPQDRILTEALGYEARFETRTIDTHIVRLRVLLGKRARHIQTVIGFGYCFKA